MFKSHEVIHFGVLCWGNLIPRGAGDLRSARRAFGYTYTRFGGGGTTLGVVGGQGFGSGSDNTFIRHSKQSSIILLITPI